MKKQQQRLIKNTFGINHRKKIAALLIKRNLRNANGDYYSTDSIAKVLNGRSHSVLEEQIIMVWREEILRQEEISKKVKKLINRAKALN